MISRRQRRLSRRQRRHKPRRQFSSPRKVIVPRLRQADENLRGARYSQANTGLTIEQSVANTYFTILAIRERIAITRQNLDLSRRLLAISQAKFAAGVSSNLDVMQETATVAGQQAQLPGLIEQERAAADLRHSNSELVEKVALLRASLRHMTEK